MNNVTIVEVINHNQVFNFNQMEQVLNQTNQQSSQSLSELLINSPRSSRSTNSCTSENPMSSPRQSTSQHQTHNTTLVEESVSGSRSTNYIETNDNNISQRSTSEVHNEGHRNKVRMAELEDGWPRRRSKRQEVVPPISDQEVANNYEHLVLPTSIQSRSPPTLSNFVPTDIAIIPSRPQVKFNCFYIF